MLPGIHHVNQDIEIKRQFPVEKDHLMVRDNQEARIIFFDFFSIQATLRTCTTQECLFRGNR